MKLVVLAATAVALHQFAAADVYMHNPRGSNNRNCGKGENRNNGNRLFDSENNAKGGYACPRAHPFDCYKYYDAADAADKATCNDKTSEIDPETAELLSTEAIVTPRMYYYTGSILPIEWTNQHGSGSNNRVHSDIVVQVACEDTLTDDCGDENGGVECTPRDGTPQTNQDAATTQIGTTVEEQKNYNRGRHETLRYYQKCDNRERNKGLFAADQDINGNSAMYTRQNPNTNRQGLECKEEAHYWPYWHDSPWVDVAMVTSNATRCLERAAESQNIKPRHECVCPTCTGRGNLPNQKGPCLSDGGEWIEVAPHSKRYAGLEAPECVEGAFSRENHLGNVQGLSGQPYYYNWTVPDWLADKKSCVLRIRYNISTMEANSISVTGDLHFNGGLSPIVDRNERELESYVGLDSLGTPAAAKLGLNVQSNQHGRTFQDRSYLFSVKARPADAKCDKIYNLNVRGKRGNIVQTYPSVEYDFIPNQLHMEEDDCLHMQWTGSDYNPARNPNNGEGGPPDPNNANAGRSDRSNIVQVDDSGDVSPMNAFDAETSMLLPADGSDPKALITRLAFLDQPIEDPQECLDISVIGDTLAAAGATNGRNERERFHKNCGKLSGAKTPYFDAGLVKGKTGTFRYISTRNNNFTNRSHKGTIVIGSVTASTAAVAVGVVGGIAAAGAIGLVLMKKGGARVNAGPKRKKHNGATYTASPVTPTNAARGGGGGGGGFSKAAVPPQGQAPPTALPVASVVTALYAHDVSEAGELGFSAGDRITVLSQDPSGWWTGRAPNGTTGIFPANYVTQPN